MVNSFVLQSWQQLTKTIMDIYVKRTHGTYIEVESSCLFTLTYIDNHIGTKLKAWHLYRKVSA